MIKHPIRLAKTKTNHTHQRQLGSEYEGQVEKNPNKHYVPIRNEEMRSQNVSGRTCSQPTGIKACRPGFLSSREEELISE